MMKRLPSRADGAGNGIHRYFKDPNADTKSDRPHIRRCQDRGQGERSLRGRASLSIHPDTGALYERVHRSRPSTRPRAGMGLRDAAKFPTGDGERGHQGGWHVREGERKGVRLYNLASAMRGMGMLDHEMTSFLATANETPLRPSTGGGADPSHRKDDHRLCGGIQTRSSTSGRLSDRPRSPRRSPSMSLSAMLVDTKIVAVLAQSERQEEKTGKARATVVAAVKDLEKARLIEVIRTQVRGRDQCNEYLVSPSFRPKHPSDSHETRTTQGQRLTGALVSVHCHPYIILP